MGVVHVLKDISERKRAEEKYRTLIAERARGRFHLHSRTAAFWISTTPFCA
jgi:hypothetical protein